jgi:hypothetical protein
MPLLRSDVVAGRRVPEQLRLLADPVPGVVLDVSAVPRRYRCQVITGHRPGQPVREDTGRTGDLVPVLDGTREDRSSGPGRARSLDGDR